MAALFADVYRNGLELHKPVFGMLAVASEQLEHLLSDEKLVSKLSNIDVKNENESMSEYGLRKIKDILFLLCAFSRKYRQSIYLILAEFLKESPEDIGRKILRISGIKSWIA